MNLNYKVTEELTIDVTNSENVKIGTISKSSTNYMVFYGKNGTSSLGVIVLGKTIEESKTKLEEELNKILEFVKLIV